MLSAGGVAWGTGDVSGARGMEPEGTAWGCAGPAGSMQCLPVLGLALHRADVSWFVGHALCDNYKNVNIGLKVPSRQHRASNSPMCVFLLPPRV